MKKVTKRFERKHGTPDFPVRVHPLSSIGCEGVTFCNWHSDYEIIYVKKGELEFHVDALHTTLKEGRCAIVYQQRNRGSPTAGVRRGTRWYSSGA